MTIAPRRILVVEDESAQRLMYEKALTRLGFGVALAHDLETARAHLASADFAVALLDLNLAGESGMELFEWIRNHRPAVSVIIATGFGNFEIAKRAISMDVVEFLGKPVSLTDLEAAVEHAWERHVQVQRPTADLRADPNRPPQHALFTDYKSLNIEDIERELVIEALRRSNDNRAAAAKLLGISERKLYYRLSQFK